MKKLTQTITAGRDPEHNHGAVNPPVYHASTLIFPTLHDYEAGERGQYPHPTYARFGTPTSQALEEALATLEEADHAIVTGSGLAAITSALLSALSAGDHLLMVDSVYGPARRFCDQELKRLGIEVTYYDPSIGAGIAKLMQKNTKVVYCESPGSLTFEMQDIPAIAEVAHKHGALVMADNTWATPLYFQSFKHGVDVSIHSITKYVSGHSDLVMGAIMTTKALYPNVLRTYRNLGPTPGSDNCYLAMRGLRTLGVRMKHHMEAGIEIARWLSHRPEVEKVFHPALVTDDGHLLWKRDMTGACSLFGVLLKPASHKGLADMLDNMELFGMGFSWGGFESLMIPINPKTVRTVTADKWTHEGQMLRLHIGLEDVDDLKADLEAGLKRLKKSH